MKRKSDPLVVMYSALVRISLLASDYRRRYPESALFDIQQLSDEALHTMNVEHTRKVQKALGIGA